MRAALTAIQFLTRIPLARFAPTAADRARAPYWYGAVGLGIGAVLAGLERLLRPVLALDPRLVGVLIVNAVLTGALHLDGLADTLDGLGGGARGLAVMRDSRIGTYGVLGLLGVLALQYSALLRLPPAALTWALLLAPGWGRAAMVLSAVFSRPARPEGLGAAFIRDIRPAHAMAALVTVAAVAIWSRHWAGAAAGLGAAALAGLMARYFRGRFGGQTGDTLGAVNLAAETATYWLFMVLT